MNHLYSHWIFMQLSSRSSLIISIAKAPVFVLFALFLFNSSWMTRIQPHRVKCLSKSIKLLVIWVHIYSGKAWCLIICFLKILSVNYIAISAKWWIHILGNWGLISYIRFICYNNTKVTKIFLSHFFFW